MGGKFFKFALIFAACLTGQAVMQAATFNHPQAFQDAFVAWQSLYFMLDLLGLIMLIVLFLAAVNNNIRAAKEGGSEKGKRRKKRVRKNMANSETPSHKVQPSSSDINFRQTKGSSADRPPPSADDKESVSSISSVGDCPATPISRLRSSQLAWQPGSEAKEDKGDNDRVSEDSQTSKLPRQKSPSLDVAWSQTRNLKESQDLATEIQSMVTGSPRLRNKSKLPGTPENNYLHPNSADSVADHHLPI